MNDAEKLQAIAPHFAAIAAVLAEPSEPAPGPVPVPVPAPAPEPAPVYDGPLNPDIDPRWYTEPTPEEDAVFWTHYNRQAGIPSEKGVTGPWVIERARHGYLENGDQIEPAKLAAAYVENKRIARMSQAEFMASSYAAGTPELACFGNFTNRAGDVYSRGATTVDEFIQRNAGGSPGLFVGQP